MPLQVPHLTPNLGAHKRKSQGLFRFKNKRNNNVVQWLQVGPPSHFDYLKLAHLVRGGGSYTPNFIPIKNSCLIRTNFYTAQSRQWKYPNKLHFVQARLPNVFLAWVQSSKTMQRGNCVEGKWFKDISLLSFWRKWLHSNVERKNTSPRHIFFNKQTACAKLFVKLHVWLNLQKNNKVDRCKPIFLIWQLQL